MKDENLFAVQLYSSSKRRRLYGTSSFALQAFKEASVQARLERVVSADEGGDHGPFLCLT